MAKASPGTVTQLLKAGRDPRRIVDVIQLAAADIVLATHGVNNFSMPMHCYEYTNALGWFYYTFDHPRRLRLLYVAAEFVSQYSVTWVRICSAVTRLVPLPNALKSSW